MGAGAAVSFQHPGAALGTIAEHIARAIEYSRCAPRAQKRTKLYEREAHEDRAYENWAFDLLDDATPAFHQQPFVTGT